VAAEILVAQQRAAPATTKAVDTARLLSGCVSGSCDGGIPSICTREKLMCTATQDLFVRQLSGRALFVKKPKATGIGKPQSAAEKHSFVRQLSGRELFVKKLITLGIRKPIPSICTRFGV
jgi:hypothetical protein